LKGGLCQSENGKMNQEKLFQKLVKLFENLGNFPSSQYQVTLIILAIRPNHEFKAELLTNKKSSFSFLRAAYSVHSHRTNPSQVNAQVLNKAVTVILDRIRGTNIMDMQLLSFCMIEIIQEFFEEPYFKELRESLVKVALKREPLLPFGPRVLLLEAGSSKKSQKAIRDYLLTVTVKHSLTFRITAHDKLLYGIENEEVLDRVAASYVIDSTLLRFAASSFFNYPNKNNLTDRFSS
jgi:hypothetical protein